MNFLLYFAIGVENCQKIKCLHLLLPIPCSYPHFLLSLYFTDKTPRLAPTKPHNTCPRLRGGQPASDIQRSPINQPLHRIPKYSVLYSRNRSLKTSSNSLFPSVIRTKHGSLTWARHCCRSYWGGRRPHESAYLSPGRHVDGLGAQYSG